MRIVLSIANFNLRPNLFCCVMNFVLYELTDLIDSEEDGIAWSFPGYCRWHASGQASEAFCPQQMLHALSWPTILEIAVAVP